MYKLLTLLILSLFTSVSVGAEQGGASAKVFEKKNSKKIEQELRELNGRELSDLKEWEEIGKNIMAYYGVDTSKSIYENLDIVYEKWIEDDQKKPNEDEIILGLGAIFGDRLRNKYSGLWGFSESKEYGDDFVVTLRTGQQIFPIDFVAKRVYGDGEESGFFSGMVAVLDKHIE